MGFEPTCQRLKVSYFAVKLRSLCINIIHYFPFPFPPKGESVGTRKGGRAKIRIYYNLLINIRVINKRTNLGKMYFENTYINTTSNAKAKVTWFIK